MKQTTRKINNQSGAAMLISIIFFIFISLAIVFGLVSPGVRGFKSASVDLNSKKSYFLAESGSEDVVYRLIKNKTVSNSETIALDGHSATTTITVPFVNTKEIVSLGDVSSYQRQSTLVVKTGDGAVFKYGTQAGQGGFLFRENSYVTGGLYSNGDVLGANNAYVTGDVFVAGENGTISNLDVGYGGIGDALASTVVDSTITGDLYCQTGSGNNKACGTFFELPVQDMPISEESITKWKGDALLGGTTVGNVTINTPTTLGPRKIVGNLTVNDELTISGTIYVTGNIVLSGGEIVRLSPIYGENSGIIISDGTIKINIGVEFFDSGTVGSYILLLSTSTCDSSMGGAPCFGDSAIEVRNNSSISIVNAQNGTVYFKNNAKVKEAVGNKIELRNGVGVTYGSGIIYVGFLSGPSGAWVIDSWEESK